MSNGKAKKCFPVGPLQRWAQQSFSRQPVEICSFSFDDKRKFFHNDDSLAYYWPSRLGTNLSDGFETLISRDESVHEHLDALLESIIHHELERGPKLTTVDLITWRGLITKLLVLPFDQRTTFQLNAIKFGNTIYIEEHITAESRLEKAKQYSDKRQALMAYWGVKYEALATIPRHWHETERALIDDRNRKVVNTNAQYCSVVRTRLGPVSLLLGGEVDCCFDYKPVQDEDSVVDSEDDYSGMRPPSATKALESIVSHYVELKTSKAISSDRDRTSFEKFKLLKFWAQSFLLGIPRIIVGFRDDNGTLVEEETFETLKIPGLVREGTGAWDGNVCINFAGEVLNFIRANVSDDCVHRIQYRGQGAPGVEIFSLPEGDSHDFLTPQYRQHKEPV